MKPAFKLLPLLLCLATITPSMAQDETSRPWGYVPADKGISAEQIQALYDKGEPKIYTPQTGTYVSMPCAGIASGQVEIQASGRFCFHEDVYNAIQPPCGGQGNANGYEYMNPQIEQSLITNGFSISITQADGSTCTLPLNSEGFADIKFLGQYPVAKLQYEGAAQELPLQISSTVFTHYVPSDVRKSANPMVMMKVKLKNTSDQAVTATLGGYLKGVSFTGQADAVLYQNQVHQEAGLTCLSNTMQLKNAGQDADKDAALLNNNFWGQTSISVLGDGGTAAASELMAEPQEGSVARTLTLQAGEEQDVTFVLSWYFPNRDEYFLNEHGGCDFPFYQPGRVGRIYNNWYQSSLDVAKYAAQHAAQIEEETMLFHDSFYNNSLPHWLSNRIISSLSTLSCANVDLWENGRFYALEGITFCSGTCGHVYNFVAPIAQLFPSMERSVRTMQDFQLDLGYNESGRINFRGHGPGDEVDHRWASDAQSGYILKAYREHLMSEDKSFLDSVWPQVKMAIGYQIFKDGAEIGLKPNGVLECEQTFWDPMWYGPNPYNNTLYLAALRAAEEMAKLQGEEQLAAQYHALYLEGRDYMSSTMWNGEYYAHLYPNGMTPKLGVCNGSKTQVETDILAKNYIESFNQGKPTYYVSTACDANQLFGQNWADQLGLGDILPRDYSKIAMKSVYKYNFTPDIGTVYNAKTPWRVLASKEQHEGAMINGSWPKEAPKDFENTHDKSDIWSGLEYDAICNMITAGLLDEALVAAKAINERYDGAKRNPWNEIEGSDHYSRAMQSWNILRCLSGQTYDGPKGILRFKPCFKPENFKAFFPVAVGWGSYAQEISNNSATYTLNLKYGKLKLEELHLPILLEGKNYSAQLNGQDLRAKIQVTEAGIRLIELAQELKAGDELLIKAQ